MKKLLKILAVLVLVVIAGLLVLYFSLGAIVRKGLEVGASDALDTKVQVGGTRVTLLAGEMEISRMEVANPEGFEEPRAFSLGRLLVQASIPSFLRDVIEVPEIRIDGMELTVEQAGLRTNIGVLLDNLEGEGKAEKPPAKEEPRGEAGKGPGKSFRIGLLYVSGAKVRLGTSLLKGEAKEVALPDIELRDIGTDEGGPATLGKVLAAVLRSVLSEALGGEVEIPEAARKLLSGEIRVGEALGQAGEAARKAAERTVKKALGGEAAKALGDEAAEAAKKAVEGLKGIFGGKK